MRRPIRNKLILGTLVVLVLATAAGLWAFQPWKLFTRSTVNEALPAAAATQVGDPQRAAARPEVLDSGSFVSGEHATSGRAKVVELADGRRILRLEKLSTSDGPDVRVVLSTQPPRDGAYDSANYVELGQLKATDGNQNYAIPSTVELDSVDSAVIWCARFDVTFGSADLKTSSPPE